MTAAAAANACLNAWIDPAPDYDYHARFAVAWWNGEPMAAPHPLWQWVINGLAALAGRAGDHAALCAAGAVALTAAAAARAVLLDRILVHLVRLTRGGVGAPPSDAARSAAVLFLGVAAAAPNWWNFPRVGLGQFGANLWHNPTLLLMSPFAAGAVLCLLRGIAGSTSSFAWGGLWLGLSALAKPSAATVILPVVGIAVLLRRIRLRDAVVFGLPAVLAIVWIVARIADHPLNKGVAFAPFLVWNFFTRRIGLDDEPIGPAHKIGSFAVSFAFPLAATLLLPRPAALRPWIAAAWIAAGGAVAQFALVAERGGRWSHGNFTWGVSAAVLFLFVVGCAQLVSHPDPERAPGPPGRSWRVAAVVVAAALHLAGGAIQLARALLGHDALA